MFKGVSIMAVVDDASFSYLCAGPGNGQFLPAKTGLNVLALTAGNIVATQASVAAMATALNDLTLGLLVKDAISIGINVNSGGPSVTSNRGSKWIITAQEVSGDLNKFTYTIPAADASAALAGTNTYDPANAKWIAFVAAFNGKFYSPAGVALNFVAAKLGGRRA
jgi:hypothetical protein